MSDQIKPVSRPLRRYLRFSVRGLIVIVLVIGGGLGWLVRSARIQRDAVVAIERERGAVRYNGEHIVWDAGPGWHEIPREETRAPRWLVDLIGVDYFHHVTTVSLQQLPGGTGMVSVGRLTSLEALDLFDGWIDDAGLENLKGLTKLSSLNLDGTQITDAGLVHVRELGELSRIGLSRTQITDAGLLHLKRLRKLSVLDLWGAHVTDAGLVHLTGLANLSKLDLRNTQVTDAGVRELQKALPRLNIKR